MTFVLRAAKWLRKSRFLVIGAIGLTAVICIGGDARADEVVDSLNQLAAKKEPFDDKDMDAIYAAVFKKTKPDNAIAIAEVLDKLLVKAIKDKAPKRESKLLTWKDRADANAANVPDYWNKRVAAKQDELKAAVKKKEDAEKEIAKLNSDNSAADATIEKMNGGDKKAEFKALAEASAKLKAAKAAEADANEKFKAAEKSQELAKKKFEESKADEDKAKSESAKTAADAAKTDLMAKTTAAMDAEKAVKDAEKAVGDEALKSYNDAKKSKEDGIVALPAATAKVAAADKEVKLLQSDLSTLKKFQAAYAGEKIPEVPAAAKPSLIIKNLPANQEAYIRWPATTKNQKVIAAPFTVEDAEFAKIPFTMEVWDGVEWRPVEIKSPGQVEISYDSNARKWSVKVIPSNATPGVSTTPPGTKTPETKTPETKTPETKTPETKTPETKTPETKTPETKTPEKKTSPDGNPQSSFKSEYQDVPWLFRPVLLSCVGFADDDDKVKSESGKADGGKNSEGKPAGNVKLRLKTDDGETRSDDGTTTTTNAATIKHPMLTPPPGLNLLTTAWREVRPEVWDRRCEQLSPGRDIEDQAAAAAVLGAWCVGIMIEAKEGTFEQLDARLRAEYFLAVGMKLLADAAKTDNTSAANAIMFGETNAVTPRGAFGNDEQAQRLKMVNDLRASTAISVMNTMTIMKDAIDLYGSTNSGLARIRRELLTIANSGPVLQGYTVWRRPNGAKYIECDYFYLNVDCAVPYRHQCIQFDSDPDYVYYHSPTHCVYWGRYHHPSALADGSFEWVLEAARKQETFGQYPKVPFKLIDSQMPIVPNSVGRTVRMLPPRPYDTAPASEESLPSAPAPVPAPPVSAGD